jgi:hypothetical protein
MKHRIRGDVLWGCQVIKPRGPNNIIVEIFSQNPQTTPIEWKPSGPYMHALTSQIQKTHFSNPENRRRNRRVGQLGLSEE